MSNIEITEQLFIGAIVIVIGYIVIESYARWRQNADKHTRKD